MKLWQWMGMVVVLLIIGAILIRLTYILRTGQDLRLDAIRAATPVAADPAV